MPNINFVYLDLNGGQLLLLLSLMSFKGMVMLPTY
ncbi:Uncharacterised protein [Shigella sonnei]|nr:Uncharacterised protein [Shigella sonnei]